MRADLAARLGQIRWNLHPLWGLAPRVDHKNDGLVESNLLSLSYGQVVRKDINEIGGLRPDSYETYNIIAPGDTVLRMTDLQNDQRSIRTGLATERGIITSAYITVRPDGDKVEPRFLHSVLRAYDIKKTFYEMGVGVRQTLKYAELADLPIPLPPRDTQRAIADYLDRETGEIDAMLAKLDVLNEALNSRRASVVERETVARSGSLTRLKFCADISLGKTFQGARKSDYETSVNYVRAASIQPGGLELDDQRMWMTQEEQRKYDLRKDDVLVVEGGAGFGRSALLTQDMPGWGFQNHVIRVRRDQHHDGRFLNYCVKGHYSSGLIGLLADGATIPGLSSDKAKNLPIPDMSLEEQQRIAAHLDEVTGRIDAMLAKVTELKALLVERRAALITDVVTGRKKVPA